MNTQSPHFPIWSAFGPKVVRERCAWCKGMGVVERPHKYRALMQLEECAVCKGSGAVTTERIDVGANHG